MAAEANIVIRLSNGQQAGETIKELRQQANRLTKEINNLKPGTEEFVKKSKDMQMVSGRLKDVRGQVYGVTQANNGLLQTMSQFVPFGGHLQNVAGGFQMVGMALKAIPLIFIIGLIVKMIQYWAQMQSSIESLRKVTIPLNILFQKLIGVLQQLADSVFKKLAEAIEDPKQAIQDLGDVIKDNVVNRITAIPKITQATFQVSENIWKAFGSKVRTIVADIPILGKGIDKEQAEKDFEEAKNKISEGFEDLANANIQFATGMENGLETFRRVANDIVNGVKDGLKDSDKIIELTSQIEQQELSNLKTRDKRLAQVKRLNDIVEDTTKTEEERIAAGEKALALQQAVMEADRKLIAFKVKKREIELAQNTGNIEDEKELQELKNELFKKDMEIQEASTTMRNKVNILNDAIAKKEIARQKEIQKALEERLALEEKARRNIQDLAIAIMEEGQDKEIARIALNTERKIEALIGSEELIREQEILLEEEKRMQIQAVIDKYESEKAQKEKEARDKNLEEIRKTEEAKIQIQQMGLAAFGEALDTGLMWLTRDEKARKKHAAIIKGMEIARIAVGLQAEIQAIWEYANKNPANALFPGAAQAIAGVKTGLAVGRAAFALRAIERTKFEQGGILRGARHSQGGIPAMFAGQPIEMEDGEIILNRRVGLDPRGRAAASALNAAYGGRRFDLGGPVNGMSGGSSLQDRSPLNMSGVEDKLTAMMMLIKEQNDRINSWQSSLKVTNSLQETSDGIKTLNKLYNDASL